MRWHVIGIPAEVRRTARQAAKAAGLPLGPWLERAIWLQLGHGAENQPGSLTAAPLQPARSTTANADTLPEISSQQDRASQQSAVTGVWHSLTGKPASRPWVVTLAMAVFIAAIAIGVMWLRATPSGSMLATNTPVLPATAPPPAQSQSEILGQLQRDALAGEALAQHDLALAYVDGRGVPQNYEMAAVWFEKAALAGLERAQFNLAMLFENALGVPQDFERAFLLYKAAAEQGFGPAQHNLAVAYIQGRGTERDNQAAALWFRRAADQGIASAQFNLGMIFETGLAGPPDEKTAYGWYRLAAAAGSDAARARLAAIEARQAKPPSVAQSGAGKKPTKPVKPTTAEIAEIQRLLVQLAFSTGKPDGKVGPATRAAIRHYEQIAALPVTGEATVELLDHLRQVTALMAGPSR